MEALARTPYSKDTLYRKSWVNLIHGDNFGAAKDDTKFYRDRSGLYYAGLLRITLR